MLYQPSESSWVLLTRHFLTETPRNINVCAKQNVIKYHRPQTIVVPQSHNVSFTRMPCNVFFSIFFQHNDNQCSMGVSFLIATQPVMVNENDERVTIENYLYSILFTF